MTLPANASVLIIGAGPSGLMMAAQLLRYGIIPVIVDAKQGPTNQSKALAVQARSMEIFRQMGLAERVVSEGKPAAGAALHIWGKPPAELSLSKVVVGLTPFPYVFMYPQSKNERVLLDYLTLNCCPVYWNTTLQSIVHNADNAEVTLLNNGQQQVVTCTWLIGADGAHSIVRKSTGITFNGDTYQHKFYLADVKLAEGFQDDFVHLFLSSKGFAGFFLMPEAGEYRVVGNIPAELSDRETLQINDVLPHLQQVTGTPVNLLQVNWFTSYKLHHSMADKFRSGRCFLIGDAAHIHSPVGGQGMNTGLQDAYNLAWKLAGVLNGKLNQSILNSYADERMPVARDLLNSTDRIFNVVTSQSWANNLFKKYIAPQILKFIGNRDKLKTTFFNQVSQLGINYRDSKLNLHLGKLTRVKAGDRLPFLEIYDEKKQALTDIHAWCSKPGFTLITIGVIKEDYLFTLAKWITLRYPGTLNFFHLPPSGKNRHVLNAFEIGPGQRKAIIVRPDMYISYMNDVVDIEMMNNYLKNVVGFIPNSIDV